MDNVNDPPRPERGAGGDPASRRELDHLEALRRKPAQGLSLTPRGTQTVHAMEDARREARIRHLDEALQSREGQAKTGFDKAQVRGKAKHDFDRSR